MTTNANILKQAQDLLGEPRSGEILLGAILKKNRAYLYAYPDQIVLPEDLQLFHTLISRRAQGEPIAYLLGEKEFYSLNFKVTRDTLIPRPETEMLIDEALKLLPSTANKILELGTGSGAIAITLAKLRPNWQIMATDISGKALKVAIDNAQRHEVNNIDFILSDWFSNIPAQKFDLIISNPPYVANLDPHLDSLRYEPLSALQAGVHGLDDITTIIKNAPPYLINGGMLLLEHGYNQEQEVKTLLKQAKFREIETLNDLGNCPRVTRAGYTHYI